MKVTFWGCRGSLPASYGHEYNEKRVREILQIAVDAGINQKSDLNAFIEDLPFHLRGSYGTNTSCVQIVGGSEVIICDAGSGIRDLGKHFVMQGPNMPKTYHILMSHLHWDHIQGFPFFIPAYIQGVTINIYGCHDTIEQAFIDQQDIPTFPVA